MAMPDIRSQFFARKRGRRAYQLQFPIYANPYIGQEAAQWRLGYREAQQTNGGKVYTRWPKHGQDTGFRQAAKGIKSGKANSHSLGKVKGTYNQQTVIFRPSRQSGAA